MELPASALCRGHETSSLAPDFIAGLGQHGQLTDKQDISSVTNPQSTFILGRSIRSLRDRSGKTEELRSPGLALRALGRNEALKHILILASIVSILELGSL